jgi:uncharacterized RDD family membrane protein YckC
VTQPRPNYQPPPGGYSVPPQSYPPPGFRPPPTGPGGAPLADFGQRLLARLLDGLILSAILIVPTFAIMAVVFVRVFDTLRHTPAGEEPNFGPIVATYFLLFVVVLPLQLLVQYLYVVTYQVRKGQTVGKRVMKIKVVRLVDGSPMDTSTASKRFLVEVGCAWLGPLAYLDGLWQLWDQPYKQCLHDKWAKTVVVRMPA